MVGITCKSLGSLALLQGVLLFGFNTAILALKITTISGQL
jgi:uncharacterized membrane protein